MKFLAILLFLLSAAPSYATTREAPGSTTVTRSTQVERDDDGDYGSLGLLGLLGLAGLAGLLNRKRPYDTTATRTDIR